MRVIWDFLVSNPRLLILSVVFWIGLQQPNLFRSQRTFMLTIDEVKALYGEQSLSDEEACRVQVAAHGLAELVVEMIAAGRTNVSKNQRLGGGCKTALRPQRELKEPAGSPAHEV